MTQDDEPDSAGSRMPESPPSAGAVPVLAYHGLAPFAVPYGVNFHRTGDLLTITLPPASIARRITVLSIAFLVCALPTLLFCSESLNRLRSGRFPENLTPLFCPSLAFGLLAWGAVGALRRIVYTARFGRQPSTICIWPDGIAVRAHGAVRPAAFSLSRDAIAHVQLRYARQWMAERLWLEISTKDGMLHLANLRWPMSMPTQKLQDALREVLKLSPEQLPAMPSAWS